MKFTWQTAVDPQGPGEQREMEILAPLTAPVRARTSARRPPSAAGRNMVASSQQSAGRIMMAFPPRKYWTGGA